MRLLARPISLFLIVMLACLAVFFHRSVIYGEVFSPADLVFSFYPWSYDHPRVPPSNITRSDEVAFHQPLVMTHWPRLRSGDFPDWDPLVLSGSSAFFQGLNTGSAFSPLSAPFYVLPLDVAPTVYAALRLFCAAMFMFLFLRYAGLGLAGALAGSVAFAFNGAFVAWLSSPMPTIALFLPLIALAIERAVRHARAADAGLVGLALGLQFLGSYIPTSIVVAVVSAAYAVWWLLVSRKWKSTLPLAIGGIAALGVAAVALLPMIENLATSPASARSMAYVYLPADNLATFTLQNFWGTPLDRNWWGPGDSNFPEYVTYLGVATWVLAGIAIADHAIRRRDRRVIFFALLSASVLLYLYGIPPLSWARMIPGFRQMNPMRWNVALAFGLAVLAAYGVESALGQTTGARNRWTPMMGAAAAATALAAVTGTIVMSHLPDIRSRQMQDYEKAQIVRFAAIALASLGLVAWGSLSKRARSAVWAGAGLVALIAVDLVGAGWKFNPTLPRQELYPTTPGLEQLQLRSGSTRVAPVGQDFEFLQSHVWSVFGISTVTGFDFRGDRDYQQFLAAASGAPFEGPRWAYVEIKGDAPVNLKLLGLLDVEFIVTPPVDVATLAPGYVNVGELTAGRVVRQTFVARQNGLRRVDVLTATHARRNRGRLRYSLREVETNRIVAFRDVEAESVRDNDWLHLEVPTQPESRGRTYEIEMRALSGEAGSSITLWGSQAEGYTEGAMNLDGQATDRDLWFRAFSTAPDRIAGAPLVFSGDLNIYRNPLDRPRAWFVSNLEVLPAERQLARLLSDEFDPRRTAVTDSGTARTVASSARVTSIDMSEEDMRRVHVEAPQGGVMILSERFSPGWHASVDGKPATIMKADFILSAVELPPGAREVRIEYREPNLRRAMMLTAIMLGALLVGVAVTLDVQ